MDLSTTTIETKRLLLVPCSKKYAGEIFLEYNSSVAKYMNYGPAKSRETLEARLIEREREIKEGHVLYLVVLLRETKEFLGCFGLENLETQRPELGGWLKKSAHGNGFGHEAAAAIKKWADKNLEYSHIVWPCASLNTASKKLAESLGGKIQREYEKRTASGKLFPYVEYHIPCSKQ